MLSEKNSLVAHGAVDEKERLYKLPNQTTLGVLVPEEVRSTAARTYAVTLAFVPWPRRYAMHDDLATAFLTRFVRRSGAFEIPSAALISDRSCNCFSRAIKLPSAYCIFNAA